MTNYLRVWRESKKLTLELVAERLGNTHTTVGRWESGKVRISVKNLERLAGLYGVPSSHLLAPPEASDLVKVLDRTQAIAENLSPDALEKWLSLGEAFSLKP